MKFPLLSPLFLLLSACSGVLDKAADDTGDAADEGCAEPEPHPRDTSLPEWSYHGEEDGPEMWGSLPGYETCDLGPQQSPIDIADASTVASADALTFNNYALEIPLALLNNGHTLEVEYSGTQSSTDPSFSYLGQTWYLAQFHGHSTSEHTLDGAQSLLELHFVHKDAEGNAAVVGVLLDEAGENTTVGAMLEHDPGPEMSVECEETVSLLDNVPTESGFYHYAGSLTTPKCSETVQWFVMIDHGTVSAGQAEAWQSAFGGTTNRPVQALGDREVLKYTP